MGKRQSIPGIKNVNDLRLYTIWSNMKSRCYDKKREAYRYYGAKGIKLCPEWKNSFVTFYNWANANGYADTLTIDRIDSSKDYTPDNCQWISRLDNCRKQQRQNTHSHGEHKI